MRHILLALVFLLTAAVSAPAAKKTFSQFAEQPAEPCSHRQPRPCPSMGRDYHTF